MTYFELEIVGVLLKSTLVVLLVVGGILYVNADAAPVQLQDWECIPACAVEMTL